ncbi:MAG TPA: cobalamin B12-binding domain-containing protein [Vicinamibacterales bacterium]|nr:cobalamin B12-binding domain-containing protein [Vicinamibacterales bacterium]
MRILFIENNGIQESIGIANLSGILKAHGHETDLLLVSHTPDPLGAIRASDPHLIAFSALTGVHHSLERLAVRIKQQLNIPIIVGGPHPTYSPDMIERPGIDIICRGEGELALLELAEAMQHDRDVTGIRNLHVKTRDGKIHKNELRPPVPLDDLPPPDRELYYKYTFLRDMPMKPIPALRYFHNTVLMTGKFDLSMTMRTIPSLLRRKKQTTDVLGQKEIWEAQRGYF